MLRWWEGWGGAPGCYRYACVSLKFICWCVFDAVMYIYIYMYILYTHILSYIYFHTYRKFRELSMSSLQPASKVWDRALWTLWKRTCCSMLQQGVDVETTTSKNKGDYQHVPFHDNIKNIANTNKKTALHITPRAAVKTLLFRFKKSTFHDMCYLCGKQEKKLWKRTCCSRLMKLKQQRAKKRLTINMCPFMLALKFTANTNKQRHLFILPHVPQ